MIPIRVSMLPAFAENSDLSGQVAVVIDILRASTTIVHALANGANSVVPCATVKQAWKLAEQFQPQQRRLGGERHCQKIEGFDLDNSPLSYSSEIVAGRDIIFTSTNGTYALEICKPASHILIGAFVNLQALTDILLRLKKPVHLVCAGTNRQLTAEDILFAGAVIQRLTANVISPFKVIDVQGLLAVDFFNERSKTDEQFRETMFESLGAENLIKLGLTRDIERAMQFDLFETVPAWDSESSKLIAAR